MLDPLCVCDCRHKFLKNTATVCTWKGLHHLLHNGMIDVAYRSEFFDEYVLRLHDAITMLANRKQLKLVHYQKRI